MSVREVRVYVDAQGILLGGWDDPENAPAGAVAVDTWPTYATQRWNGTAWSEYVPPVPASVTNFQARAALMRAGKFAAVDAEIKRLGGEALAAWEYANDVDRHGALVEQLGRGLGMTDADIDAMFVAASTITA